MDIKNIVIFGAVLVVTLIVGLTARNIGATPIASNGGVSTQLQETPGADAAADGDAQDVTLRMEGWRYITEPSTLTAGVPVRMTVDLTTVTGCMRDIVIPAWNVRKYVSEGDNVILFTPQEDGQFPISCSMGMGRGVITVGGSSAATGTTSPSASQEATLPAAPSCGMAGSGGPVTGGCGCGAR